jgi:hypothetical protein
MSQKPTILELLTMEELETLENLVGKTYTEIFTKTGMTAKAAYSLHWILQKRNNPEADIANSKKLNVTQLNKAFEDYTEDPKDS